jgi:hypothetical protein
MTTRTASAASLNKDTGVAVPEAIKSARGRLGDATPTFGTLFVSPDHNLEQGLAKARALLPNTPILGCTTAGEFTEAGLSHGGVALMLVASDEMIVQPALAGGIKAGVQKAVASLCGNISKHRETANAKGFGNALSVLLVDGLAGTGEQLVDELRAKLGGLHEIVGGAAGDEGRFKATHTGTGAEARTDAIAALHVASKRPWGVGVDHGLTAASKIMRVTRAKDNVVFELDGKPAFEVYKSFAKDNGVTLEAGTAGTYLINHELGVYMFDKMRKARAPLAVNADGSLSCAAAIPQGASVAILDGKKNLLTAAAKSAAQEAKDRLGTAKAAGVLVFDCICRGTILGSDFDAEIAAISAVFPDVPVAGFLTYGEIARYSGRLDGWHNTTAVVVAIPA